MQLLMLLAAMRTWPIDRCPDALWTLALDRGSMFETCGSSGHQSVLHIEASWKIWIFALFMNERVHCIPCHLVSLPLKKIYAM